MDCSLCSWNSPGKNTGVGSHSLLEGIFPTQGLNPGSTTLQAGCLPSEPPANPILQHTQTQWIQDLNVRPKIIKLLKQSLDGQENWDRTYDQYLMYIMCLSSSLNILQLMMRLICNFF